MINHGAAFFLLSLGFVSLARKYCVILWGQTLILKQNTICTVKKQFNDV